MNIAIIFAGGRGTRMGVTVVPKQFLEIDNKPVIILTIESFQRSDDIDAIIVVTLNEWIEQTWDLVKRFNLNKVVEIVEGGETGQLSIYNGVKRAIELYGGENIVLINDGVRPFIDLNDISDGIKMVQAVGASAASVHATETVAGIGDGAMISEIYDRGKCIFLKAPQCFWLGELYSYEEKAISAGKTDFVDSASLVSFYGKEVGFVETSYDNIKITTKKDIAVAKAIKDRLGR